MTDPDRLDQTAADSAEATTHQQPPGTRQPRAGRFPLPRRRGAWVGATLSLIAVAGGLAVLVAVSNGRGMPLASSSTPRSLSAAPSVFPAPPAGSGVSKANSSLPSAAQVAERGGAMSLPAGMQSIVLAWQSGSGGTGLAAVTSLFGTALQQKGLRQYALMKHTCTQLTRGVVTAQAGPPIPVAAMQTVYAKALAELAAGAADCQAAITVAGGDESLQVHFEAALLDRSAAELAAGSRDIFRSTAEIVIASRASQ